MRLLGFYYNRMVGEKWISYIDRVIRSKRIKYNVLKNLYFRFIVYPIGNFKIISLSWSFKYKFGRYHLIMILYPYIKISLKEEYKESKDFCISSINHRLMFDYNGYLIDCYKLDIKQPK